MVTIIIALVCIYFLSKGMLKLILRGAEDYSHGVRSFPSLFFRGVGLTIMDSGAAGALAIAGLLLYWVNMVASTVNPVAYENYPLLRWLLWGAGILFLLAAGFAVFRSLRCMCIVGLMIIVGSVLAEILNLFICSSLLISLFGDKISFNSEFNFLIKRIMKFPGSISSSKFLISDPSFTINSFNSYKSFLN